MELDKYVGLKVKIDLTNGFYYEGIVISVDNNSLRLKDKFGKNIDISESAISFLRELDNGS